MKTHLQIILIVKYKQLVDFLKLFSLALFITCGSLLLLTTCYFLEKCKKKLTANTKFTFQTCGASNMAFFL